MRRCGSAGMLHTDGPWYTSGLLALYNPSEPSHEAVSAAIHATDEPMVVSPFVVAELGYLVATRLGVAAELEVLGELAGGACDLAALDASDVATCAEIVERYRDQEIGVADASLVLLADRHRTRSVLTLDHRHFDVLRPLGGGRFELLPS